MVLTNRAYNAVKSRSLRDIFDDMIGYRGKTPGNTSEEARTVFLPNGKQIRVKKTLCKGDKRIEVQRDKIYYDIILRDGVFISISMMTSKYKQTFEGWSRTYFGERASRQEQARAGFTGVVNDRNRFNLVLKRKKSS